MVRTALSATPLENFQPLLIGVGLEALHTTGKGSSSVDQHIELIPSLVNFSHRTLDGCRICQFSSKSDRFWGAETKKPLDRLVEILLSSGQYGDASTFGGKTIGGSSPHAGRSAGYEHGCIVESKIHC